MEVADLLKNSAAENEDVTTVVEVDELVVVVVSLQFR